MKKVFLVLVLTSIVVVSFALFAGSNQNTAVVKKVYDGDTLLAKTSNGTVKVRVLGIDCPESFANDKCKRDGRKGRKGCRWQVPHGKKAKAFATKLLRGKSVTLECDGKCKSDNYDRLLRYVRLPDGTDLGLNLVENALCEDFSWKFPHPRQVRYRKAQKTAKKNKKGIWK